MLTSKLADTKCPIAIQFLVSQPRMLQLRDDCSKFSSQLLTREGGWFGPPVSVPGITANSKVSSMTSVMHEGLRK